MQTATSAAIAAFEKEFFIEKADRPELVHEAFRLRYQVYCVERGFEAPQGYVETDDFDDRACHIVLRHRASRMVVGTARLVLMSCTTPDDSFPLQRVCDDSFLRGVPLSGVAEISRFAISKELRMVSPEARSMLRLSLVRGLVLLSGELGLTHWCALMEPTLLRLLRATGMHFEVVGPLVEHHGTRQPSFTSLEASLARMQRERHDIWNFVTDRGKLLNLDKCERALDLWDQATLNGDHERADKLLLLASSHGQTGGCDHSHGPGPEMCQYPLDNRITCPQPIRRRSLSDPDWPGTGTRMSE